MFNNTKTTQLTYEFLYYMTVMNVSFFWIGFLIKIIQW